MNKNMSDTLPVICENAGRTIEVAMGTTLLEVERRLRLDGPHPFLAAYVNNRIKELNYRIYKPVTVRFIDITSFEGIRVISAHDLVHPAKGGPGAVPRPHALHPALAGGKRFLLRNIGLRTDSRRTPRRDQGPHARDHRPQPADPGGEDAHRHGPQNLRRVRNGR